MNDSNFEHGPRRGVGLWVGFQRVTVALLFGVAALFMVVLFPPAVERLGRAVSWTNNHWSAFGTILGAFATFSAVAFSLYQHNQLRATNEAGLEKEAQLQEEDAVRVILSVASRFVTVLETVSGSMLQQLRHNSMLTKSATSVDPNIKPSPADIREAAAGNEAILDRQHALNAAKAEAIVTIALELRKVRTPDVRLAAQELHRIVRAPYVARREDGEEFVDWDATGKSAQHVWHALNVLAQITINPFG